MAVSEEQLSNFTMTQTERKAKMDGLTALEYYVFPIMNMNYQEVFEKPTKTPEQF